MERIARALADVVVARDAGLCMVGLREALLRALLDEGVLTDDCIISYLDRRGCTVSVDEEILGEVEPRADLLAEWRAA